MPTTEQIREALRAVIDPELRQSIVDLGMVRSIEQPEPGRVDVVVSLTTAGCPIRNHFQTAVAEKVQALGVDHPAEGVLDLFTSGHGSSVEKDQRRPFRDGAGEGGEILHYRQTSPAASPRPLSSGDRG